MCPKMTMSLRRHRKSCGRPKCQGHERLKRQESRAVAKMTARCAQCMGDLKK